jgi:membrane protein implicated in regulation of membrane protease activity
MILFVTCYALAALFAGMAAAETAHGQLFVLLAGLSVLFALMGGAFHMLHNWTRELDRRDARLNALVADVVRLSNGEA